MGRVCNIITLSAPPAVDYYPPIRFECHRQAWVLPAKEEAHRRNRECLVILQYHI